MLGRRVKILFNNRLKSALLYKIRCFASDESFTNNVAKKPTKQLCKNHYDVVIIGGGMIGTTLASAIGKNDYLSELSVLLLEASEKSKPFSSSNYSNRVSALNQSSVDLLKSIGAWNHITSARFKTVKRMQVWDAISDTFITFNEEDTNNDLAFIVENDLIMESVLKTLKNMSNIEINYASKIEKISTNTEKSTIAVTLKDGETFSCNLLVGADGAKSIVRHNMNVNTFDISYKQLGIVATLEVESKKDGNATAWQRFLLTGPIALLPLTDTLSSLVWSTTTEETKKLIKMTPEDFTGKVNEAFNRQMHYSFNFAFSSIIKSLKLLPTTTLTKKQTPPKVIRIMTNSRAVFPLGLSHASSYVKNGMVLIGDAAHRIHPLAGQGVNLGFGDIKSLTTVLEGAVCNGAKINNPGYLLQYEKERLLHNVPVILGIHALQRLYCTDLTPVVLMRSIGLQITHSFSLLKKFFIKQAMH
ncbi:ubiquinone biosynthesis monooxygenase COQ6, mitochondrial [Phlebotomus papatasi]|uniref:ubiquinone biosynthesis monooxygenase COQ6, mitochondrial n=1 Tax=Phlebotomus papatasi TaxID=29031 RepID=UPI00248378A8|nr:ubiquinone biosynthesis monooxygenase COQ6, mitochondrial [Phlebotomus papatasi]